MKHRSLLLTLSLVFCFMSSKAQFEGLGSFFTDTVLRAQVIANRVSSVTLTVTQNGSTNYNGRYDFDLHGRVIETNRPYMGNSRMKMEYFKGDLIARTVNYDKEDTTKIANWRSYTYDEKDRRIKEESVNYFEGKSVITESIVTKILVDQNGWTNSETNEYYSSNELSSTQYRSDSINGIYTFTTTYKYRPNDVDEKGRKSGEKILKRFYTKDRCSYEDELQYEVYGRIETVEEITTRYKQFDEKGRLVEAGKIDYQEVYMNFIQEHPEEYNFYYSSPLFVKAVLEGTVQGERKQDENYTFDTKGLLVEKHFYGSNYKLKYNDKRQLIEITCDGPLITTELFWYNEKGLVSKTVFTSRNPHDTIIDRIQTQECAYTYTYY